MKITDRVKKVQGIEDAHWDGAQNRLVIYYLDTIPLDTVKVGIAATLRDAGLQDSISKITLVSVSV